MSRWIKEICFYTPSIDGYVSSIIDESKGFYLNYYGMIYLIKTFNEVKTYYASIVPNR